ncbi:MAG TPA: hypothetical protein VIF62_18415 [Labilithrix sp.]|jgi:hypothetical protein
MFIPIVRRTVTVRVRESYRFPYSCDFCRLVTAATAWAEGIGSATMAYVSPDENAARYRARQMAYATAQSSFMQCPCPRCGSHSAIQRNMVTAWEQRAVSRKNLRFWILIVGLAASFLLASGCSVAMVAQQGLDGDTVGGAVMLAIMTIGVGAVLTGIIWAASGPGKRPSLLPYIPPNVVFDPPDPAQQPQAGYRMG